ncbi:MAG: methionine adenosyltransferase [Brevinemataceae bacterium]
MSQTTYFTSEFVSIGHPDKIADQIADAVLDACLAGDSNSRVACEVFCTTGLVVIGGEISTNTYVEIQEIARRKIKEIGYKPGMGFDSECGILNTIHSQSHDIAMGVDIGGAGDQGIIFGGAVNETPELMPMTLILSRAIINKVTELRKNNILTWVRPDAKSQVTLAYSEGKILYVDTVVVSVQHDEQVSQDQIHSDIKQYVIQPVMEQYGFDFHKIQKFYINPTGRFVIGGPNGDTGLTGRKIIVDTYGGYFRNGGGAFSGKDSSKVDRSAAYAARWVAKNIVAAELAEKCEVQLSYAIGVAAPVSLYIDTFGTSSFKNYELASVVQEIFDLSPYGIEQAFQLRNPAFLYQDLAARGHFGRMDIDLPWEQTNRVEELHVALNYKK